MADILGTEGNDILNGTPEDDFIQGLEGNDQIDGGTGRDDLRGGDGDDTLDASEGDSTTEGFGDYIRPGFGNNTILGNSAIYGDGEGIDISYADLEGTGGITVTITSGNGSGTVTSGNPGLINDTFTYTHYFEGTPDSDTFTGGASTGNGELWAPLAGDDVINGGDGWDSLRYNNDAAYGGEAGVVVDMIAGTATDGFGDTDTFSGIEDIRGTRFDDSITGSHVGVRLRGEGGNDSLIGGDGDDRLEGGAGFDYIEPGAGDDTVDGGDDLDQVSYSGAGGSVTVDLAAGTASDGDGGTDTLISIERARGGEYDDELRGDDGDNQLIGRAGDDILDGRGGFDVARYDRDDTAGATAGITVDLAAGTATDGFGDSDTLISIEGVRGTEFDDDISGTDGDNYFRGHGGDDTLDGGEGDDYYTIDGITENTVNIFDSGGFDTLEVIDHPGRDALTFVNRGDTLVRETTYGHTTIIHQDDAGDFGIEQVSWYTEDFDEIGTLQVVTDLDAIDRFDVTVAGTDEAETIVMPEGDAAGVDAPWGIVYGNGGDDDITASDSFTYYVNGGDGDDTIRGGDTFGEGLYGDAGNDRIEGGGGDDFIRGGAGDDTAVFDIDLADVEVSQDGDAFILTSALGTDNVAEVESFEFADRTVTASELAGGGTIGETLTGTPGDDELEGGDGPDTIRGLGGADTLIGNGGDDTIEGGDGTDFINGGDGDDTIEGGATSADRRDEIYGGAGDDSIDAGYGNDLVFGM
ncbi:calcium-binding protein, partial [Rhodovulum iodosum]